MLPKGCDEKQLVEQYEILKQRMQTRIDELAKSYQPSQPLNQYLALLQCDVELEQLDQELCELENLLPDSDEFDSIL